MNPISAVWPGRPFPRGAIWDGEGANLALFSEHAGKVELCVFDDEGRREPQQASADKRRCRRGQWRMRWRRHERT